VMETEIWPNFLREARKRGVPVIFANARISEKSFTRYKKWEFMVGAFYDRAMGDAAFFLAQTPDDAMRLAEMGAPQDHIEVTGNLKYDSEPPAVGKFSAWLENQARQQERWPLIVAGSVVEAEEEPVLAAYDIVQRRWRRALLIIAPRKPDRFDSAAIIAATGGWKVSRRSQLDLSLALDENTDVLLLDSIGELAGLYAFADIVFVGGSLAQAGGHNILEPAWFSKPPVFGPSMENFREMAAQFLKAQAGIQVTSAQELAKAWIHLVENDALRARMGAAARQISERNRGATARSIAIIAAVLEPEGRLA
jgi:3-deoxy-D-manno-octulosonic-acid transferase